MWTAKTSRRGWSRRAGRRGDPKGRTLAARRRGSQRRPRCTPAQRGRSTTRAAEVRSWMDQGGVPGAIEVWGPTHQGLTHPGVK
eukprot:22707-Chlamydomonas_euryale.AAC.20